MTILVVDDLRTFRFTATYARTSAAAMPLLDRAWDEVWLDHDLGGDDTTMPIVDRLAEKAFFGQPANIGVIVVHSSNPAGCQTMIRTLQRYGYRVQRADAAQFM